MPLNIDIGARRTLTANLSSGNDAACTWTADRAGVIAAWSPDAPQEVHDPHAHQFRNTRQLVIVGRAPGDVTIFAGTEHTSGMFAVRVGPEPEKLTITSD